MADIFEKAEQVLAEIAAQSPANAAELEAIPHSVPRHQRPDQEADGRNAQRAQRAQTRLRPTHEHASNKRPRPNTTRSKKSLKLNRKALLLKPLTSLPRRAAATWLPPPGSCDHEPHRGYLHPHGFQRSRRPRNRRRLAQFYGHEHAGRPPCPRYAGHLLCSGCARYAPAHAHLACTGPCDEIPQAAHPHHRARAGVPQRNDFDALACAISPGGGTVY
jgi:hypothetical protein